MSTRRRWMQLAPEAGPALPRRPSRLLRLPGSPAVLPPSPPGSLVPDGSAVQSSGSAAAAAEPGTPCPAGRGGGGGSSPSPAPGQRASRRGAWFSRDRRSPCGLAGRRPRGDLLGAGGWGRWRQAGARPEAPPGAPLLSWALCAPLWCTHLFCGGEV